MCSQLYRDDKHMHLIAHIFAYNYSLKINIVYYIFEIGYINPNYKIIASFINYIIFNYNLKYVNCIIILHIKLIMICNYIVVYLIFQIIVEN